MADLKKLSNEDMEKLPAFPVLTYFSLRGSVERGVKSLIKPWQLAKELGIEEAGLQAEYDKRIQEYTDTIMGTLVKEFLGV